MAGMVFRTHSVFSSPPSRIRRTPSRSPDSLRPKDYFLYPRIRKYYLAICYWNFKSLKGVKGVRGDDGRQEA